MAKPDFTHFGRYRIVRELGQGAMGVVYLAEDESLQRQVAVKTMQLPEDPSERSQLEGRFRQEAKAAGGLNHPAIITIHDLGREGDWLYIAMELLDGVELRDLMSEGLLTLALAMDIGAQVADGLAAAHQRGIVHRDIKPSNIMVLPGHRAKIMDFGVARMQASEVRTQTGVMLGSPKYMSPEQVEGQGVDHRSDIFSLGSMLYEMVTGQPAFNGQDLGSLLAAIVRAMPPAPSQINPAVPPRLDVVIMRAIAKDPAERYQDAGELARELRACEALVRDAGPEAAAPSLQATDVDIFGAGTRSSEATRPLPVAAGRISFAPSRQVDSTAAIKRLLHGRIAAAAPAAQGLTADRVRLGWLAAGAAAALASLWIALG